MTKEAKWVLVDDLSSCETWQMVADRIGSHPHTYDLSDSSHRLDVVQIVLTALLKVSDLGS